MVDEQADHGVSPDLHRLRCLGMSWLICVFEA